MTNADRIRAMSNEELARVVQCQSLEYDADCDRDGDCEDCILNWLKQEAES